MKTERRHELQTNVLADSLAHWIEAIKPYGRAILAGGIARDRGGVRLGLCLDAKLAAA